MWKKSVWSLVLGALVLVGCNDRDNDNAAENNLQRDVNEVIDDVTPNGNDELNHGTLNNGTTTGDGALGGGNVNDETRSDFVEDADVRERQYGENPPDNNINTTPDTPPVTDKNGNIVESEQYQKDQNKVNR